MSNSKWRWLAALAILLAVIVLLPPTRHVVLGLSDVANPTNWFGSTQQRESFKPIDAATLAGHPGLYYQDAAHLIGQLDPARYSAYQDLIAESKIDPDATIYTDKNLPTPSPVVVPTLPNTIAAVKAGLGLASGGTSGTVSLEVVPGDGIILTNGKVNAILGDTVDLSSAEVVSILPVAKGGTGLSMAPLSGTILVGTGIGYTQALLSAGDGLILISGSSALTYALDNTVCRTTGNCSSLGIVGTGSQNYLAKFTGAGAIGDSILFDDGSKVGIGTSTPQSRLDVVGGLALGTYAGTNAAPANGLIVSGLVGIGTTNPVAQLEISSSSLNLIQTTRPDSTGTSLWTQNLYSSSSFGPTFLAQMAKGTVANPQPLTNNIHYLTLAGNGYDGLAFARGAQIYFSATETWSSTGHGTDIEFYNAANGSATPARTLVIKNNGLVGIGLGAGNPLNRLDVNGGIAVGTYAGVNAAPSNGLIVSGNVGIGVASSGSKLDIRGSNSLSALGSEALSATADRDFSSDTGNWTGTNWAIGSGVVTHTAGSTAALTLNISALSPGPVSGRTYLITASITNTSGTGSLTTSIGGVNSKEVSTGTGTLSGLRQVITTTGNGTLTFVPTSSWTGTIDNVSVKEITPSDGAQRIYTDSGTLAIELRSVGDVLIGIDTGRNQFAASSNVGLGNRALQSDYSASFSVALGDNALQSLAASPGNSAIGYSALSNLISGSENTAVGEFAMRLNTGGSSNVAIGPFALSVVGSGSNNVAIGYLAGYNNAGSSNVFLGYNAGSGSTGSNKLYIDNSSTASPLIFGDFSTDALTVNGTLTSTAGLTIGTGGTKILKHLSATSTWDPPSIASGGASTSTVTVAGAALGDVVSVGFSQPLSDNMGITGWVSAANTVKISISNLSGSAVDLSSGTVRADVWQH